MAADKMVTLRMDGETVERMDAEAKRLGISRAAAITQACFWWLQWDGEKRAPERAQRAEAPRKAELEALHGIPVAVMDLAPTTAPTYAGITRSGRLDVPAAGDPAPCSECHSMRGMHQRSCSKQKR